MVLEARVHQSRAEHNCLNPSRDWFSDVIVALPRANSKDSFVFIILDCENFINAPELSRYKIIQLTHHYNLEVVKNWRYKCLLLL